MIVFRRLRIQGTALINIWYSPYNLQPTALQSLELYK